MFWGLESVISVVVETLDPRAVVKHFVSDSKIKTQKSPFFRTQLGVVSFTVSMSRWPALQQYCNLEETITALITLPVKGTRVVECRRGK